MLKERWSIDDFMEAVERAEPGRSITFGDVLITPGCSSVVPRDVNLETRLTERVPLHIPLLSADMDTVTEPCLAIEMANLGGMGFLWKHPDVKVQTDWVQEVKYRVNGRIDKPITIQVDQTLDDVRAKLVQYKNNFSSLVVLDNSGKVVGLVTGGKTKFARGNPRVEEFMVKNPVTSDRDLDIRQAYELMMKREIGTLILVNETGGLRGLYCWGEVANIVEKQNPMENRDERGQLRVGANVGILDFEKTKTTGVLDLERAEKLLKARCDVLLVGTAHGHSANVINTIKALRGELGSSYQFDIVAGNVATYEGARALFEAGADCVKVGIGPGAICDTRIVAGAGVPQVTAIHEASKAAREFGRYIIGDGGIKQSGDITKAMVAGADSVMMGSLLAGADESAGEIITYKGKRCKYYRGMGSLGAMKDNQTGDRYKQGGLSAAKLVPEGIESAVECKGPVSEILYQLLGGLRSGMGYAGASNIQDLKRARFNRPSTSGQRESHPSSPMIKEPPNYRSEE
jgi:IMP dehydrogenase